MSAWARGQLEAHPHSTIDDSTVERCPGIDCPAAIGGSLWAQKRVVPSGLPCVGQVLAVEKETQ